MHVDRVEKFSVHLWCQYHWFRLNSLLLRSASTAAAPNTHFNHFSNTLPKKLLKKKSARLLTAPLPWQELSSRSLLIIHSRIDCQCGPSIHLAWTVQCEFNLKELSLNCKNTTFHCDYFDDSTSTSFEYIFEFDFFYIPGHSLGRLQSWLAKNIQTY